MKRGIICYNSARKITHRSIAMDEVQENRKAIRIQNGRFLHQYANLYFDFHNPMLYKRQGMAETICILAVSASVLDLQECVVSDRNAASKYARFFPALDGMKYLDFSKIFAKDWRHTNVYEYYAHKKY